MDGRYGDVAKAKEVGLLYNDRHGRGLLIWRPRTVYKWARYPRVGNVRACRSVVTCGTCTVAHVSSVG